MSGATVKSIPSGNVSTRLSRSNRQTETQAWSGETVVTTEPDAAAENGVGLEAGFNRADYDVQAADGAVGMRSQFRTLINHYGIGMKGLRFPYNSGATARLSRQEIKHYIGEFRMLSARGMEYAALMADRLALWNNDLTQPEAAEFLGLSDLRIRELDADVIHVCGPMSHRSRLSRVLYPAEQLLVRKKKYRPGVAEGIMRRKLSTKPTRSRSTR
jgi:hypothetical protein